MSLIDPSIYQQLKIYYLTNEEIQKVMYNLQQYKDVDEAIDKVKNLIKQLHKTKEVLDNYFKTNSVIEERYGTNKD